MAEETAATTATETTAETKTEAAAETAAKTFTQAELDKIVQDRVARAKTEKPADYEELQAAAKKLAVIEEANKTELEKQTARADKAEADAKSADDRVRETTLRSAIIAEAAKRQVVDPDAAVALIDRTSLELDDTGNPTNIAKAMDALLKTKPYLAGAAKGDADQGARSGGADQLGREALESMSDAEITKATAEGRFNHLLKT